MIRTQIGVICLLENSDFESWHELCRYPKKLNFSKTNPKTGHPATPSSVGVCEVLVFQTVIEKGEMPSWGRARGKGGGIRGHFVNKKNEK